MDEGEELDRMKEGWKEGEEMEDGGMKRRRKEGGKERERKEHRKISTN